MAFLGNSSCKIKIIPTSDVADMVGKQQPMRLVLSGAFNGLRGDNWIT